MRRRGLLLALPSAVALSAWAQPGAPLSSRPYPGRLELEVDATDLAHRVVQVVQTLPVRPGPLTLRLPQWLPGEHGPNGNPALLAGLTIESESGAPLRWQRDTIDALAFRLQVPAGVNRLRLRLQHLSPQSEEQDRVTMTPALLGLEWNNLLLYPEGHTAAAIETVVRLRLPAGWQAATALRAPDGQLAQADAQGWWQFGACSLERLIDSPLFAGPHYRRVELDPPGAARPVVLHLFGDTPADIAATPAQLDAHRALVQQADRLYGSRHYRHYDFLLAVSDRFGGIGLEHHESSENAVRTGYFKDWDKSVASRGLLPHEYTHSWCGKFRRPADLLTRNYEQPMRGSLLWVYEGMTTYWGDVLTPRSGLCTLEQARDALAYDAATLEMRRGRTWRSLQDTTSEPLFYATARFKDWPSWQRTADYYAECTLLWLDVDTLIRERSGGRRSLDDAARALFGVQDGRMEPLPYTFEDVVAALTAVQPHDWRGFLRERLDGHGPGAPLDGLARSGWRLGYTERESEFARFAAGRPGRQEGQDLSFSIGLRIAKDGRLKEVLWDSPAFAAGLAPGGKLVAVNDRAYDADLLADAITANIGGQAPLALLLREGDDFRTVRVDYRGGLRYPQLVRVDSTPDRLSEIMAPRA
ncbi:M61 family metallopeptidase [Roseateles cellulosilyticus]|uniref:Peptidase M61 n=1 Tax=Pelomonas cellulosilytica TaxID=2906762 RepID=A0ABS8Y314_9BURK|nr:peptidase M61 [Pelomonas sp. P8]MCE4557443.1 peptidase M61 [Pelomonas sp. P8]